MPQDILLALAAEGLRAAHANGLRHRLDAVEDLIRRIPDLHCVVSETVRTIHPLRAEPGYDVSHSQPKWPDRIFVSFPEREDQVGVLRLAESVVHEAMHLHLTNEEGRMAFVAQPAATLYSPWMKTNRSASGLLHGMFVFHSIAEFLKQISEYERLEGKTCRYIRKRLAEIQQEIAEVDITALEETLTPHGVDQTRRWRRNSCETVERHAMF